MKGIRIVEIGEIDLRSEKKKGEKKRREKSGRVNRTPRTSILTGVDS